MFTTIFEINDIAIISVKGIDYCYVIYDLKKSDDIDYLQNSVLNSEGYICDAWQINWYQE